MTKATTFSSFFPNALLESARNVRLAPVPSFWMACAKYLVRAEAAMRTAVAYAFSKSHQSDNAYLDRDNFCAANDYLVPRSFAGNKVVVC